MHRLMYGLSLLMISARTRICSNDIDVILNVGDGDTAYTGGDNWTDETIVSAINEFVYNGGGFIGIGEPTGHQWEGKYIQLKQVFLEWNAKMDLT